jgi:hypothetical protein
MVSRVANLNPQLHRIFRVDRQWIPEDKIPTSLRKVQSVRFYRWDHREYFYRGKVRHPKEYEEAVRTLALGIDEQLNKLRNEAEPDE